MLRPQIGLLEGIPDGNQHNSPNVPITSCDLWTFLNTMALSTTLDGSQKIPASMRAIWEIVMRG